MPNRIELGTCLNRCITKCLLVKCRDVGKEFESAMRVVFFCGLLTIGNARASRAESASMICNPVHPSRRGFQGTSVATPRNRSPLSWSSTIRWYACIRHLVLHQAGFRYNGQPKFDIYNAEPPITVSRTVPCTVCRVRLRLISRSTSIL